MTDSKMEFIERMMNDPDVRQRLKASEQRRAYCEEEWLKQGTEVEPEAAPEPAPVPEPVAKAEPQPEADDGGGEEEEAEEDKGDDKA